MTDKKIKILQQVLDPSGSGGVSAEYRALKQSSLCGEYEFVPMILMQPHKGINIKDIAFYYRIVRQERPDIVHIRGAAPDGLNAVIATKLAGRCKILVSVHGMYSDLVYISRIKRWISRNIVERFTFVLADGISCVCKNANDRKIFDKYRAKMLPFVYNRIPDYSGLNSTAVRVQMRKELGIDANTVLGVYVGRVTKEKGMELLNKALQDMPSNLKMLIVGEGDYLQEFKQTANENIIFTGNQKDIYRYLFAGDFFVLPSLHENHSISLLEAAAASLPIIATDAGGNSEIVKDKLNGILIEPGRADLLSEAINELASDSNLREKLAQSGSSEIYDIFKNNEVDLQLSLAYKQVLE